MSTIAILPDLPAMNTSRPSRETDTLENDSRPSAAERTGTLVALWSMFIMRKTVCVRSGGTATDRARIAVGSAHQRHHRRIRLSVDGDNTSVVNTNRQREILRW